MLGTPKDCEDYVFTVKIISPDKVSSTDKVPPIIWYEYFAIKKMYFLDIIHLISFVNNCEWCILSNSSQKS